MGTPRFSSSCNHPKQKTINVEDLNSFEGEVNLGELGYEKLLGSGYVKTAQGDGQGGHTQGS